MSRLFPLALLLFSLPAVAKDPKPTKFTWRFENLSEEESNNQTRIDVYADGVEIDTSPGAMAWDKGTFVVQLPAGTNTLRIVNQTFDQGTFDDHTVKNGDSVDCIWEFERGGLPTKTVDLICDLHTGPKSKIK